MPATILFLGVMWTVLLGVHMVTVALARTATQAAADAAVAAAQAAEDGPAGLSACAGLPSAGNTAMTTRECDGWFAARQSMIAHSQSVYERRVPAVFVDEERGVVTAIVFGGVISPLFGSVDLEIQACGPLDGLSAGDLSKPSVWQC